MKQRKNKPLQIPTIEQIAAERSHLQRRKEFMRVLQSTIYVLLVVASLAVLIATQFLPVLQVTGDSMEPTLSDGDVIVLRKTDEFEIGDLCGFYYQNKLLLKRVIGLPGDFVDIKADGTVFLNDQKLAEPYITEKSIGEHDIEFPYQVPDSKVFVMGDHRSTSVDSRSSAIGSIEKEQIVGRVMLRVWPLDQITNMTKKGE